MQSLNNQDKKRYSRHILLSEVGEDGQKKLKSAKVLVIGAGGLGCPILMYLTAAGVGRIGIVDFDQVDETNLQRQVLFGLDDIGKNKAEMARNRLRQNNPLIQFDVYDFALTNQNALDLFAKYDIIVDGTDNFSTRYLVNDACVIKKKPLVYGSIHKFEGQVSVFNYNDGPSYRCVFPNPPEAGSVPNCSEIGVIGVLPGVVGTQQANEVLKLILGIGKSLSGYLLMYSALSADFQKFKVSKSTDEHQCPKSKEEFENFDYAHFCGESTFSESYISRETFFKISKKSFVLDVRESWEYPQLEGMHILNIPMDEIEDSIDLIPRNEDVYVVCQKGGRSLAVIEKLKKDYNFDNLINVEGGLIG